MARETRRSERTMSEAELSRQCGDVVQVAALAVSAVGAPELGLPMFAAGEALSKAGTTAQVAADISEHKYAEALKKVAIEVTFDMAGSVAKFAIEDLGGKQAAQTTSEAVFFGAEKAADAAFSDDECTEDGCPRSRKSSRPNRTVSSRANRPGRLVGA